MTNHVVVYPCSLVCPTCSHALHRSGYFPGAPMPDVFRYKCLNSHCAEHKVIKVVPLQRIDVTVEAEHVYPD